MASNNDFARMNLSNPTYGPKRSRKTFVLCFDGTGNKFSGTDGDSNILKIFRMLDRSGSNQLHYYQPGIGTYIQSSTYSHTSVFTRFYSWFQKARDSAIGSSFAEHVMGGYKFLMRYYTQGDDIYIFGFSRGAYVARFLAEMLDYIGLLEAGNEEVARFAWKAFASWQRRLDQTDEEKEEKKKLFKFMKAFRDTFSRPVRRIRFLGLFDTVNSVPRFENAWMQRSKFPYTARSSALVIRHAVSIDERRSKFRQDLIGETKNRSLSRKHHGRHGKHLDDMRRNHLGVPHEGTERPQEDGPKEEETPSPRYRRPSHAQQANRRQRSVSPARSLGAVTEEDGHSMTASSVSLPLRSRSGHADGEEEDDDDDADEALPQDIQEMWFPGCHADIGGGWPLSHGETVPLSHAPLVWIVREASKAGLRFDPEKMQEMKCGSDMDYENDDGESIGPDQDDPNVPEVHISGADSPGNAGGQANGANSRKSALAELHQHIHTAATRGILHDCLMLNKGLPIGSVVPWKIMEYIPFRRMDLQPDGSWKSIRWPLPMGEVRDIPNDAWIHTSALRRMEADESYRPGNLIIGGGGRGVRVAPKEMGMGEWEVIREKGDPIGECVVRIKNDSNQENGRNGTHEKNGSNAKKAE